MANWHERDRAHGQRLPSVYGDSTYGKLRTLLDAKAAAKNPKPQRRTASKVPQAPTPTPASMQRFASVAGVTEAGYERIAPGMYRQGHGIWELRNASDGDGYCLVRKREERDVDLRQHAGQGTQAAVEAGIVRTAQADDDLFDPYAADLYALYAGPRDLLGIGESVEELEQQAPPEGWTIVQLGGLSEKDRERLLRMQPSGLEGAMQVGRWAGEIVKTAQLDDEADLDDGDDTMDFMDAEPADEDDAEAVAWWDMHEMAHGREPDYGPEDYGDEAALVDDFADLAGADDADGEAGWADEWIEPGEGEPDEWEMEEKGYEPGGKDATLRRGQRVAVIRNGQVADAVVVMIHPDEGAVECAFDAATGEANAEPEIEMLPLDLIVDMEPMPLGEEDLEEAEEAMEGDEAESFDLDLDDEDADDELLMMAGVPGGTPQDPFRP